MMLVILLRHIEDILFVNNLRLPIGKPSSKSTMSDNI